MFAMDYSSIKVKSYKLFDEVELLDLGRVNVIIGKNNSGKSSLIDVIAAAHDAKRFDLIRKGLGELVGGTIVTEKMAKDVFAGHSGIGRWNPENYAKEVAGGEILFSIQCEGEALKRVLKFSPAREGNNLVINEMGRKWELGLHEVENSINRVSFLRLSSERDIVPESLDQTKELDENGEGASNLVRRIITESTFEESIIEVEMLDALNTIFRPDGEFEAIRIQQNNNGMWEIYLQEKGKQRLPLSKMGSGLKTIILILLNLIVIPKISLRDQYVFAFEEIENNLHPALQRRVFDYLYDYAVKTENTIFITTHSHVAINCFCGREQTSMYHIEKNGDKATAKRIESYMDKAAILSDLDVKASDLLQSNGIIWVEGPSDRTYIKRWLELFTENKYKEGQHYQFLYYGGRLLSHYSAKEEAELDDLIGILTTNRNAAIIMDSDKKNKQATINDSKKRIDKEFDERGMFSWITKGKEIENYIPVEAIREFADDEDIKECGQYQSFPEFIDKYYHGFRIKKVVFAKEIMSLLSMDNCKEMMDLQKKTKELYKHIEKWNK